MAIQLWKSGVVTLAELFEPVEGPHAARAAPSAPVGRRVVLHRDGGVTGATPGPAAFRLHLDLSQLTEADEIASESFLAFRKGGPLLPTLRRRYPLRGPAENAPVGIIMDRITSAFGVELSLIGVTSLGVDYRLTRAASMGRGLQAPPTMSVPDPAKQTIAWFILREDA